MDSKKNYFQDENGKWWFQWGNGKRKTTAVIRRCKGCGEDFLARPTQPTIYCSRECSGKNTGFLKRGKYKGEFCKSQWEGGRNTVAKGYIEIYAPNHPYARADKYVREHRLVMENYLGRYLEPYEHIHHKNGIKDDNRLENLAIVVNKEHRGEIQCPHCNNFFIIH